jgi:hypothetical protein
MKKITHLALLFLVTLSLSNVCNSLQAQVKVAYLTDTTTASTPYVNDTKILPMFKADPNFAVTKIQATVSGQDLTGYDLIVISEPPSSSATMVLACKGIDKPVLNMKVFAYKTGTTTWAWVSANGVLIDNATALNEVVYDPTHPIFTNMGVTKGSEINMLSAVSYGIGTTTYKGLDGATSFVITAGKIDTLATIKDATTGQLSILEMPVGLTIGGTTLTKKLIQIGINSASYANVTTSALQLIKNAAYYLSGLTIITGTNNLKSDLFKINQTENSLSVVSNESLYLAIYSISGQRILETNGNSISTSNLGHGIYFLQIKDKNNTNQTIKFIK